MVHNPFSNGSCGWNNHKFGADASVTGDSGINYLFFPADPCASVTTAISSSESTVSTQPPTTSSSTPSSSIASSTISEEFCYITTTGGKAPEGSICVFPFTYRGTIYTECTTQNNGDVPWCYTTSSPQIDHIWGNCLGISSFPYYLHHRFIQVEV